MQTTNSNEGWIYIMTNPNYKDNKIGKTTRAVEERRKELSRATGVPQPFEIFYTRFFKDCHQAEKDIHAYLAKDRVKDADREFFSTPTFIAMQVVDRFYYEEKFKSYDNVIQNLNETIDNQQREISNRRIDIIEAEIKTDFWLQYLINQNIFENKYWLGEAIDNQVIKNIVFDIVKLDVEFVDLEEFSFRTKNYAYYSLSEEQIKSIVNHIFKNSHKCTNIRYLTKSKTNQIDVIGDFLISMIKV